jgi:hypothetical protein
MKRLPQIFMGPKAKEQILQRWDPVSRTIVNVRCPCTNPVQAEAPPPHPPPEPDVVVTRFYANIYPDDFRSIDNDSRVTYIITFTSSLSSAYTGTFKIGFNNASESYEDATILTDSSPHINYPATESLLYTKDVPRPSYIFGQLIFDDGISEPLTFRSGIVVAPSSFIEVISFIVMSQQYNAGIYATTLRLTYSLTTPKSGCQLSIYNNQTSSTTEYNFNVEPILVDTDISTLVEENIIVERTISEAEMFNYNSTYYAVIQDQGVRVYSPITNLSSTPP